MNRPKKWAAALLLTGVAASGMLAGLTVLTKGAASPAPVELQSDITLDRYQVEEMHREELTLQAWIETMNRTASGEPSRFGELVGSRPSRACTDRHWPQTRAGEKPSRPSLEQLEDIFVCNRISAVQYTAPQEEWKERLEEAAALLWQGTSPTGGLTLAVARQGYLATREDNKVLDRYGTLFSHCQDRPEISRWLATPQGDSRETAGRWLAMQQAYADCINAVHQEWFPLDDEREKN